MAKLKGQSLAVTATVQTVAFGDTLQAYTLTNDGSDDVFYRFMPKDADTFEGNAAALRGCGGAELKSGESVVLLPPVPSIQIVAATAESATVRVLPGAMAGNLQATINATTDADDCTAFVPVTMGNDEWTQVAALNANTRWVYFGILANSLYVQPKDTLPSDQDEGLPCMVNGTYRLPTAGKGYLYARNLAAGNNGKISGIDYHD